ncbi:Acid-sensing ion channel 1 [Trichoplax sp. H2]|nr:Acid-sensing ion channel 1 [Trichoplax sp. H2]|eukprot:RDD47878.1 Acid-sensing ion channel 1 [Trichoplax sp. H2]
MNEELNEGSEKPIASSLYTRNFKVKTGKEFKDDLLTPEDQEDYSVFEKIELTTPSSPNAKDSKFEIEKEYQYHQEDRSVFKAVKQPIPSLSCIESSKVKRDKVFENVLLTPGDDQEDYPAVEKVKHPMLSLACAENSKVKADKEFEDIILTPYDDNDDSSVFEEANQTTVSASYAENLHISTKDKFEFSDDSNYDDRFALQTSCNGIVRIFGRGGRVRHAVWFLLTLTMTILCIITCVQRYDYLFTYPTNAAINYTISKKLKFPAVSVCNFNRFRFSSLEYGDWHRIGYLVNLFTATDNNQIFTGLNGKTGKEWNDYLKNISFELYDNITFDITQFLNVKSNQAEVFIKHCTWNDGRQPCSIENFTRIYTDYGSCFTFNAGADAPILYQKRPGSRYGLKLILNIEEEEYTHLNPDPDIGIKFRVHNQFEPPDINAEGIAVPPGYHAYTKLLYTESDFLKPPWGNCGQKKLKYFKSYSRASCQLECLADSYRRRCDCRTPYMPGSSPICSPEHIKKCVTKYLGLSTPENFTCNCPNDCRIKSFNPHVTYAEIPLRQTSRFAAHRYGLNELEIDFLKYNNISMGEYIRDNYVFLDLFYDDLSYTTFKEKKAYDVNQFISDIGGQLGLFLGGSFLTFWEIFEWSQIKSFLVIRKIIHEYKKGRRRTRRRFNSTPEDTERLL